MILFLLLVFAYSVLVRQPLERTLAERRARTTGAVEQARGAIAAAEAETAVYEDKLRAAGGWGAGGCERARAGADRGGCGEDGDRGFRTDGAPAD